MSVVEKRKDFWLFFKKNNCGFKVTYFFRKVNLTVFNERKRKTVTNVCGTIKGRVEPGFYCDLFILSSLLIEFSI